MTDIAELVRLLDARDTLNCVGREATFNDAARVLESQAAELATLRAQLETAKEPAAEPHDSPAMLAHLAAIATPDAAKCTCRTDGIADCLRHGGAR
jgi:hypothetical protein